MAYKRKRAIRRPRPKRVMRSEQTAIQQTEEQEPVHSKERPPRILDIHQRRADIAAHQDALGNRATMALIERQADEEAKQPMTDVYQVGFDGEEYNLTPNDYQSAQAHAVEMLKNNVTMIWQTIYIMKRTHERFEEYHNLIGAVSDFLKVKLPSKDIWSAAEPWLQEAEAAISQGRLDEATTYIKEAQAQHNQAEHIWHEYQKATDNKRLLTEEELQITDEASFEATDALSRAEVVSLDAAETDGGPDGLGSFFESIEDVPSHISEGESSLQTESDPLEILSKEGKEGAAGFVEALVSGPLAQKFFGDVLTGLPDDALRLIAETLSTESGELVTINDIRSMFEGEGPELLVDFLSDSAGRAAAESLTEALMVVFQSVDKGEVTKPEQFMDLFVKAFLESEAALLFILYARSILPHGS